MARIRVHNLSMSLDGYVAGPDQSIDNPLGRRGEELHKWVIATPTWNRLMGRDSDLPETVNDSFIARGDEGIGAWILGRNMFGPIRGPWRGNLETDDGEWRGWWGDSPPYHCPVFVLTHHARPPMPMEGGTTFYFVTEGIEAALEQAVDAAGGADVRIGGGASTVRQYLRARLIDELHFAIAPVLLGAGERPFDDLDGAADDYECAELMSTPSVAHVRLVRKPKP